MILINQTFPGGYLEPGDAVTLVLKSGSRLEAWPGNAQGRSVGLCLMERQVAVHSQAATN
jgi:hypothetical protein